MRTRRQSFRASLGLLSACSPAYFLHQLSIIMTADRELVDDISKNCDEKELVEFSREELGIHSDMEVEKYERFIM